jgi:hypothetical protein
MELSSYNFSLFAIKFHGIDIVMVLYSANCFGQNKKNVSLVAFWLHLILKEC